MTEAGAPTTPRISNLEPAPHQGTVRFGAYPWFVRSFIVFSVAALALNVLTTFLGSLGEYLEPTIGGITSFCLFMVANVLVFRRRRFARSRLAVIYGLLALALVWAALDLWRGIKIGNSTNPWLRHSAWRPAWTFGLPVLSAVLLSLKSARRAMDMEDAA